MSNHMRLLLAAAAMALSAAGVGHAREPQFSNRYTVPRETQFERAVRAGPPARESAIPPGMHEGRIRIGRDTSIWGTFDPPGVNVRRGF